MKELALKVFRQPPDRLNCAQSVLHAWREVFGDTAITVAELKPFGAGRASDGLCGALYAACRLAPSREEELKAAFAARLGSLTAKKYAQPRSTPVPSALLRRRHCSRARNERWHKSEMNAPDSQKRYDRQQ